MPGSWDGKSRPSNNTYRKNFDEIFKKNHEYGWLEAKQSGGAVYGLGVKESKRNKAIRRIAQPLTDKHWKDSGQSVTKLHRIQKIAEYLLERTKRNK